MTSRQWTEVRLGDLVKIKHGWALKSEFFSESGERVPIVVNIGNFRYTGGFRFESTTIKGYSGCYPSEFVLSPGDILLVMTCQTEGGEILGVPGRIPDDGRTYLHNQRLGKVIVLDKSRIVPDFLYWLFLSPNFNRYLATTASGTKILHTSPDRIESYHFLLPGLSEQRAIANILNSLDNKVEHNSEINRMLEYLAQSIFKSWFIDFDPVRARAEGKQPFGMDEETAALFPSEFEDSELGEVPRGWKVVPLKNLMKLEYGYHLPVWERNEGQIPVYGSGGLCGHHDNGLVKGPGIVIGRAGKIGPNSVYYSPVDFCPLETTFFVSDIRPENTRFLYFLIKTIQTTNTGSSVPNLNRNEVLNANVVHPGDRIILKWDSIVESLLKMAEHNSSVCSTLICLRDYLLPKLLSGEIRVPPFPVSNLQAKPDVSTPTE